jgi:hypothetical protein
MGIQISPFGNNQFLTPGGQPAAGYQLFVYAGRSTDKVTVYTDKDGLGKHTNPIILDTNGFTPSPIYIDTTKLYKFVLAFGEDLDPPTMPIYPVDQVSVGLETATVSTPEWSTGTEPSYVSANQFSVIGDQTATYHTGRRLKLVTVVGSLYGTCTGSGFSGSVTTVTVQLDTGTLDATLSAVYYSFLSARGSSWPGGYSNGLETVFAGPVTIPLNSAFNLLPVGSVFPCAANGSGSAPPGFLRCTGQAVSRTQYPALFASIGIIFGSGDGSTTFNVPNLPALAVSVGYVIRYA